MEKKSRNDVAAKISAILLFVAGLIGIPFYSPFLFDAVIMERGIDWTNTGIYLNILLIACSIASVIISIIYLFLKKCLWAKIIIAIAVVVYFSLAFLLLAQGGMQKTTSHPPHNSWLDAVSTSQTSS